LDSADDTALTGTSAVELEELTERVEKEAKSVAYATLPINQR